MRVCWKIAVLAFSRSLAYRVNALLRIVGNSVTILIQVAIWHALIGQSVPMGIDLSQMVTYSILSTCITMVLQNSTTLGAVDERLRTGNIAVDLVRPIPFSSALAADSLGVAAFQGIFTMLPTLVVAAALFGINPPASSLHLLTFAAAILSALAISFALGYLFALLAFWFLTAFHFEWTLGAFIKMFAGTFLPLWFFPTWLSAVVMWLPFPHMVFVPVAVYLGQIPRGELGWTLSLGIGLSVALLGLAGWLWSRAVRRLVLQGW